MDEVHAPDMVGIRTDHLADILRRGDVIDGGAAIDESDAPVTILTIKARLKRTGREKKFVVGNSKPRSNAKPDASLLKLIARAQELQAIFLRGGRPIAEMATAAGVSSSYFTRVVRLSFLAPDITRAILQGDQPAEINARKLMADTRVPIDWDAQRTHLGFI